MMSDTNDTGTTNHATDPAPTPIPEPINPATEQVAAGQPAATLNEAGSVQTQGEPAHAGRLAALEQHLLDLMHRVESFFHKVGERIADEDLSQDVHAMKQQAKDFRSHLDSVVSNAKENVEDRLSDALASVGEEAKQLKDAAEEKVDELKDAASNLQSAAASLQQTVDEGTGAVTAAAADSPAASEGDSDTSAAPAAGSDTASTDERFKPMPGTDG